MNDSAILLPFAAVKKSQQLCYLILLAASAVACASLKVGFDYDRSANFGRYHSYAWMEKEQASDKRLDSSLVDARIRSAIDTQLRTKGYAAAVNRDPEFLVNYHVGIKDVIKGSSTQNYIGDRAHGTFTTISDIQSYNEGTLLIDIVDAGSQKLVWQASANAEVNPGLGPKERDERINSIVHAMLAHFPPQ